MKFNLLLATLTLFGCASGTYAQSMIDAGRVEDQLNLEPAVPPATTAKPSIPKSNVNIPQGAEAARFFLKDVIIEGASIYPASYFNALTEDLENREVSVAELYKLTGKITDAYRKDWYVMAQAFVPPQNLANGIAKITVVEPFIAEVRAEGKVPEGEIVQKILAPWHQKKILNVNELETSLLRINDLPRVRVQSVIEPQTDSNLPGALVLRLQFTEDPQFAGHLSLDNFGSKFVGPYQMGANISMDNLFGYMSETNIQTFVPTQIRELLYGNIEHHIPALWSGFTFNFGANYSRVVPGYTLSANNVKSQSRALSIGVTQSVIRSRNQNLAVSASLETRNSTTKTLGTRLSEDKLTIAMVETAYENADNWNGMNIVNAKVRQGLNILGARETGSSNLSRLEGKSDFLSFQLQATRLQSIAPKVSILGSIRGQYTPDPLLSSEEFGYGGNAIGRAYNASEIVGDRGISATIEARYHAISTPRLALTPYAFYDVGKVWNIDRVDGTDFSGASAGIGIRTNLQNGLTFDTYIAQPLTRRIETPQYGSGKSPVLKFSLEYQF